MENDKVDRIIDEHQGKPGSLIQVLLHIQSAVHWLPRDVLEKVSRKLEVPFSRVMQIATFYKIFSLTPKGRNEVQVCTGSSCTVRGSSGVLDALQNTMGIRPGETDADSKFSLQTCVCMGCCNLGPEIIINGKHHGKMTPDKAKDVLKDCD